MPEQRTEYPVLRAPFTMPKTYMGTICQGIGHDYSRIVLPNLSMRRGYVDVTPWAHGSPFLDCRGGFPGDEEGNDQVVRSKFQHSDPWQFFFFFFPWYKLSHNNW